MAVTILERMQAVIRSSGLESSCFVKRLDDSFAAAGRRDVDVRMRKVFEGL